MVCAMRYCYEHGMRPRPFPTLHPTIISLPPAGNTSQQQEQHPTVLHTDTDPPFDRCTLPSSLVRGSMAVTATGAKQPAFKHTLLHHCISICSSPSDQYFSPSQGR